MTTDKRKSFYHLEEPSQGIEALALLSLLANYNKFEFANPYRHRLEDFVSEDAITRVNQCVGSAFDLCRDAYLAVQDDQVEGWNPLSYIGLGAFGSAPTRAPILTEEEMKKAFASLSVTESQLSTVWLLT